MIWKLHNLLQKGLCIKMQRSFLDLTKMRINKY